MRCTICEKSIAYALPGTGVRVAPGMDGSANAASSAADEAASKLRHTRSDPRWSRYAHDMRARFARADPLTPGWVFTPLGPLARREFRRAVQPALALAARCRSPRARALPPALNPSAPAAPSRTQLVRLGIAAGVPFVGFGIADNGIMILAGDYIDGTLGVKFGLSTMAAAGIGNLISDVVGVSMGEVIESFCATRLGLRAPALTEAQLDLRVVHP